MSQPAITNFFGSKKRRATEQIFHEAKLLRLDPEAKLEKTKESLHKTPIKVTKGCDIRSFLASKSPRRPEIGDATPTKVILRDPTTPVAFSSLVTPGKSPGCPTPRTPGSILRRPEDHTTMPTTVKKTIRFDDSVKGPSEEKVVSNEEFSTEDLIEAANKLVSKLKEKKKILTSDVPEKSKSFTPAQLAKRAARNAKLCEVNASLAKLTEQASDLLQMGKKKEEAKIPKLTKFDSIDVEVPRSPHKGALDSPKKRPAYERFAHLASPKKAVTESLLLPLPFRYQRLFDLFCACDSVCSMIVNRGETITFKKLKPAVQEMSRLNFTERHLAQIAAVMPDTYSFRQEKIRNFGSTSKVDKYELVITPLLDKWSVATKLDYRSKEKSGTEEENLITAADRKKITPRMLNERKAAFQSILLNKTIEHHNAFLSSLDPPIAIPREQLARWHPNFMVDLVPDIPPIVLPQPPEFERPSSAKDVLEKAKQLLNSNKWMLKALDAAASSADETAKKQEAVDVKNAPQQEIHWEIKKKIDKKLEKQNPLKGISKSLLEKIRAKQAAKALEVMQMTAEQRVEADILSQLPDIARTVRTIFVDNQKNVLAWHFVLERIVMSSKWHKGKGEAENLLNRLITKLPEWISSFEIKHVKYLKIDRSAPLAPLIKKLADT